eukprot:COSAG02_NODE_1525_length_12107_cov_333.322618_5_plen_576_part_00
MHKACTRSLRVDASMLPPPPPPSPPSSNDTCRDPATLDDQHVLEAAPPRATSTATASALAAPAKAVSQGRGKARLPLDFDTASLLFCIPFVSMLTCAYLYAALPLYFLDQSKSSNPWFTLTKLGGILLAGNILRVVMCVATNKIGDSAYLVQLLVASGTSLWMLFDPYSTTALAISMALATSSNYILAMHGLVYSRYNTHGSEQLHVRALRVLTTAEVLGYSAATVIGGVLYDFGGWSACVWFQNVCLVFMALCSFCSPTIRADCRLRCSGCVCTTGDPTGESSQGNDAQASYPVANERREFDVRQRSTKTEQLTTTTLDYWPVVFILAAHSVNVASYTVEWSLFAVFFREEFGWSSSWTGVAQSTGDLLAAAFLLLQAFTSAEGAEPVVQVEPRLIAEGNDSPTGVMQACLKYPFDLSTVLAATAGLDFMIAQPSFFCAVAAQVRRILIKRPHRHIQLFVARTRPQVLMGTTYVIGIQKVSEALSSMSGGHRALYRRASFHARLVFDFSVGLFSIGSLAVYENMGRRTSFYFMGILATGVLTAYTTFFTYRLRRDKDGKVSQAEIPPRVAVASV